MPIEDLGVSSGADAEFKRVTADQGATPGETEVDSVAKECLESTGEQVDSKKTLSELKVVVLSSEKTAQQTSGRFDWSNIASRIADVVRYIFSPITSRIPTKTEETKLEKPSLVATLPDTDTPIPQKQRQFLNAIIDKLNTDHAEVEGLFRVSGSNTQITQMREGLNSGPKKPHILAGALKRELGERSHIFSRTSSEKLLAIVSSGEELTETEITELNEIVQNLDSRNREILGNLLGLCKTIVDNKESTKMDNKNLATCLAPRLISTGDTSGGTEDELARLTNQNTAFLKLLAHFEQNPDVYQVDHVKEFESEFAELKKLGGKGVAKYVLDHEGIDLSSPDFHKVLAGLDQSDWPAFSKELLTNLFIDPETGKKDPDKVNKAITYVKGAMAYEVGIAPHKGELLRGKSLFSVAMSEVYNHYAHEFLTSVVSDVLKGIGDETFEVDPSKISEDKKQEMVEDRQTKLLEQVDQLFASIDTHLDKLPDEVRKLLITLSDTVSEKFPEDAEVPRQQVSSQILLRCLNPRLVAPETIGLARPSTAQRRALILISKIAQNAANKVEFGGKEEYMLFANKKMEGFQTRVSTIVEKSTAKLSAEEQPVERKTGSEKPFGVGTYKDDSGPAEELSPEEIAARKERLTGELGEIKSPEPEERAAGEEGPPLIPPFPASQAEVESPQAKAYPLESKKESKAETEPLKEKKTGEIKTEEFADKKGLEGELRDKFLKPPTPPSEEAPAPIDEVTSTVGKKGREEVLTELEERCISSESDLLETPAGRLPRLKRNLKGNQMVMVKMKGDKFILWLVNPTYDTDKAKNSNATPNREYSLNINPEGKLNVFRRRYDGTWENIRTHSTPEDLAVNEGVIKEGESLTKTAEEEESSSPPPPEE